MEAFESFEVPVTWYFFYEVATGRLVTESTVLPEHIPPAYAYITMNHRPDVNVYEWDPVTLSFVLSPPEPPPPEEPEPDPEPIDG